MYADWEEGSDGGERDVVEDLGDREEVEDDEVVDFVDFVDLERGRGRLGVKAWLGFCIRGCYEVIDRGELTFVKEGIL